MKQIIRFFTLMLLFTFVLGISTADAQRRSSDSTEEYFDESGGFKHKLWYGGGFNFNFSPIPTSLGNVNTMQFGVSPMVGYKVTDFLSVGPRVSVDYLEIFLEGTNPRYLLWSIGPFVRAKFSETIFAHVEYELQGVSELNDASSIFLLNNNGENFYIGAGYQSSGGGLFGYEILALYNLLEDNEANLPITFRIGFNYNF